MLATYAQSDQMEALKSVIRLLWLIDVRHARTAACWELPDQGEREPSRRYIRDTRTASPGRSDSNWASASARPLGCTSVFDVYAELVSWRRRKRSQKPLSGGKRAWHSHPGEDGRSGQRALRPPGRAGMRMGRGADRRWCRSHWCPGLECAAEGLTRRGAL